MPPEAAHRIHRELSSREWRGPLAGPDGKTVFEFFPNATPNWAAIAAAYRGRRPAPDGLKGAQVEIGAGDVEAIQGEAEGPCEMPGSTGIASLALVDRVLGIPRGNPILGGHAVVRISERHRAGFTRAWNRLLEDAGGATRAAATLAPYLERYGNGGREEAVAILAAVTKTIARAKGDSALVFVCAPVP